MANSLKHSSVGTELTQTEWEAIDGHVFESQAKGDLPYAESSSSLRRLAIGSSGQLMETSGAGLPAWTSTPTIGSTSWSNATHAHAASNSGGTVAGSALSGSSLASGITSSSLTSVGTIATGVWQGTAIGAAYVTTLNQNTTGTAATVTGAAQSAITSLGTLTALTGGTGDFNWDSGTLFVDSSEDYVGIGITSSLDAKLHVVGAGGYQLHLHRGASSSNYMAFTNDATGATLGTNSLDIGLSGSGYALIRHREEEKIAIGTDGTNRLVINAAGGMSEIAISGTAGVVRASIYKTGIADDTATNIFTITSTNESGNADDGAYTAIMSGVVGHRINTDTGAHAMKAFQYAFGRTIRGDGTGVNTAVTEIYESAVAASASGTRSIGTVTMTVTETSEYVQTVAIQIDLTGSGVSTAEFMVNVELNWAEFATEPVIAAS